MWVKRTPVETLLTFCPPAPPERKVSILMSSSRISTSMVSSNSGITSTDVKEVWRRLAESNGEIRTKRCTPISDLRRP